MQITRTTNTIVYYLDGKIIGQYDRPTNTFRKFVNKKPKLTDKHNHFHIKMNAWGLDADLIKTLPEKTAIFLHDKVGKKTYGVPLETFKEKGQYRRFISDFRDNKAQIFLPLEDWKIYPYLTETL